MAPYAALLQGMTLEQKQIVVTFITESMKEPKTNRQVPTEFRKLHGMASRSGWAAAATQAHADGEDRLMASDVFEDETMEDLIW